MGEGCKQEILRQCREVRQRFSLRQESRRRQWIDTSRAESCPRRRKTRVLHKMIEITAGLTLRRTEKPKKGQESQGEEMQKGRERRNHRHARAERLCRDVKQRLPNTMAVPFRLNTFSCRRRRILDVSGTSQYQGRRAYRISAESVWWSVNLKPRAPSAPYRRLAGVASCPS